MPAITYYVYFVGILGVILHTSGDSSNSNDIVFEYLDNCDPNVDPVCKEKLESIRDQIEFELIDESRKNGRASPKLTSANRDSIANKNVQTQHNTVGKLDPKKKVESNGSSPKETVSNVDSKSDSNVLSKKSFSTKDDDNNDNGKDDIPAVYFLIIIIACTLTGVAGIALSGYCWYKLHNNDDKVSKKEYTPGVKKSSAKNSPVNKSGDRKLDYKAEMYHYVHTKNQIAAMEKAKSDHLGNEDLSNDEEDEVEDYTVYECPGLAPTGDMTVVNPLFSDQEVTGSDEGRPQSNRSSPSTPPPADNETSS